MLGYIEADNTTAEDRYWYHFRPQETLRELMKLLTTVRKDLEDGFNLPPACTLKMYKSIKDPTADPVSAVLILHGITTSTGNRIDLEMVNSDLHVFTRLALRPNVTDKDRGNQLATFNDILNRILN